ncbi:uncharacterized protein LOC142592641 [Dermacentor variabilis]|uniref:uncharacterized protein LOC142592641 n=1 Tax=Dermacentor variabilis TaxID=34621 RepID=UPI003F5C6544
MPRNEKWNELRQGSFEFGGRQRAGNRWEPKPAIHAKRPKTNSGLNHGKAPVHSSSEDDSEAGTNGNGTIQFKPSLPVSDRNVADGKDKPSKRGVYQCPHCPHVAHYISVLNVHLRKHSGEKPFKCSVCCAAFTQVGTYNRHLRMHTGEKPFKCDICPFTTAQSQSLSYHRATHARSRSLSCKICFFTCVNESMLIKHMCDHAQKT